MGGFFIMAKILVFNNDTDRMETYYRGEAEPMPYNTNGTLRVREFRGTSKGIFMEAQYRLDLHLKDHMKEVMEIKVMTEYIQLNI